MSGLLTKRTAVTLLIFFILMSGVPVSQGTVFDDIANAPRDDEGRYRPMTSSELVSAMSIVGVRDLSYNYNVMVDGMGTGLTPPTEEEWELSLGQTLLDVGADEYEVPTATSLDLSSEPYFPQVRSQGSEGSCAAFALIYYNYGYLEARDQGWTAAKSGTNTQLLSPAWTYNKVNAAGHEGSSFQENARIVKELGAASWDTYPYLDSDDQGFGNEAAWRSAPSHRISSYVSVYNPSPSTVVDLIKEQLGMHRPVSFGIDANEYSTAFADGNKIMSATEYEHVQFNHGQTIVGYNDTLTDDGDLGAFKVVNSWGASWGQNGYYFVTYSALKEMLAFPLMYLVDLEDYQPALLATWQFSSSPSVEATLEVGAGASSAPTDKVITHFSTGNINLMPTFMAMDVTALHNEYLGGEDSYYLKVGPSVTGGNVTSFRLELYSSGYVPGSPSGMIAESAEVPKAVPGVVNAVPPTTDTVAPISEVSEVPTYLNIPQFALDFTSSDVGGSGVDHLELYYSYNGASYVRYRPSSNPSGEWTGDSMTFDIAEAGGQGVYRFYSVAEDQVGNRETTPSVADASTTVDLIAPTTNISKSGVTGDNDWYVSAVTVNLVASDPSSGVQAVMYRVNGGLWAIYASSFVLSQGIHTVEYYATDRAGNEEVTKSTTIKVDLGSPTVTAEADQAALHGWYRSTVNVTLLADDAMDGECAVWYRMDGAGWSPYLGVLNFSTEGEHQLQFYATDQAGNQGDLATMDVNIDATVPECSYSLQGELGEEGRYVTAVNITLVPSDSGSGIGTVLYRIDGGEMLPYIARLQIAEDGVHLLEYYAVDLAGNQASVAQFQLMIDSHGPSVVVGTDPQPSANGWYDGAVTVTLTSEDHFDQDCPAYYRLDAGDWAAYVSPIFLDDEGWHVLEYCAVDLAGNQGSIGSISIGIDLTDPDCTVALQGTIGLNDHFVSQVSVTLSSSDQGSGPGKEYYRLNGGPWTECTGIFGVTTEGSNALEFYAQDQAGNACAVRSRTISIDTKAPKVTATASQEPRSGWFNSSLMVQLIPGPTEVGCIVHYRLNGGSWALYSGGVTVTSDGINVLEWYGTDQAGNQAYPTSKEYRLDLKSPISTLTVEGAEGENGYYVSAVEIKLASSDQGSGIDRTYLRLDGGDWIMYGAATMIVEQGYHLIEYYGQDLAGVTEAVMQYELSIDLASPIVSMHVLDRLRDDGTYLNDATVRIMAEDDISGVDTIRIMVDDSSWRTVEGDVLVEGEGTHTIRCAVMDMAGNQASLVEMSFNISMPVEAPGQLLGLTATVVEDGIFLSWSPSLTELEARYLVFRSVGGKEELIANITGTSYLDQAVDVGVKYDYRVMPLNTVGAGPSSDILGLALPEDADDTPYLLFALASLLVIGAIGLIWKRK